MVMASFLEQLGSTVFVEPELQADSKAVHKMKRPKISENIRSRPPKKNPAAIANTMTITVKRVVSSRLGHTDFLSSDAVS
jgi:hypothetical protein